MKARKEKRRVKSTESGENRLFTFHICKGAGEEENFRVILSVRPREVKCERKRFISRPVTSVKGKMGNKASERF